MNPVATEVFPTPLAVPATTMVCGILVVLNSSHSACGVLDLVAMLGGYGHPRHKRCCCTDILQPGAAGSHAGTKVGSS